MTITINPKFDRPNNYRGTFFETLAVDVVLYPTENEVRSAQMYEHLGENNPYKLCFPKAFVHKEFRVRDRRYNPFRHCWFFDDLIEILEKASRLGPFQPSAPTLFKSFSLQTKRPEDDMLRLSSKGVCLVEWSFEPIYRVGKFSSLQPALDTLKQVQNYIGSGSLDAA